MNTHFHVQTLKDIQSRYQAELLAKANVVGVGVGYRQREGQVTEHVGLLVFVSRKLPLQQLALSDIVPSAYEGYITDVIEVGEIKAFQERTDVWRPALGGVSIGHKDITAGTFGGVVLDKATGKRLILSNNHVLANSNNAQPGDAILQPGPYDGGSALEHQIAVLDRFAPIQMTTDAPTCNIGKAYAAIGNFIAHLLGSSHRIAAMKIQAVANYVDAAVASPLSDDLVGDEILDIGLVCGIKPAELGMKVHKSGRTTGYTVGEITALNVTTSVSYGTGKVALFTDQIMTGPISKPGDSGSLLLDYEYDFAVGLLFAGSDTVTIYNPIQYVLEALGVEFEPLPDAYWEEDLLYEGLKL